MKKISKIPWAESIWFFDIDDTLIDTAGTTLSVSEGIMRVFQAKHTVEETLRVRDNFNDIFNLMMIGYRVKNKEDWQQVPGEKEAFEKLLQDIGKSQNRVKERYGTSKKWSREVFIKFAADKTGIQVTPELVHEAADAYWVTLTEQTMVYPQAFDLIQVIKRHNRPIYLLTSSDGRLNMDDEGQFDYDPRYSEALKRQRIELLRERGVNFNALSIGDPEDKPHLDFFEKAIKIAERDLGKPIVFKNAIMVGDSFGGDL
ncbi:hypothetical protein HYT18_04380 [Candidatus Microgenomates bacterium]|nr:hypothetical protein [Candidatus Microgenomates bacterium]